jgi:hypothetical protein
VSGLPTTLWTRFAVTLFFSATPGAGGPIERTEYKLGDGVWATGRQFTLAAPADHSGDGVHTVFYRSTDVSGNVEPERSVLVRIDTTGPATSARSASARKGRAVALRYIAADALSAQATGIKLVVKNSRGVTVKTISLSPKTTGVWYSAKWTPRTTGTFRYYVYAKDLAGNAQRVRGNAKVVVR